MSLYRLIALFILFLIPMAASSVHAQDIGRVLPASMPLPLPTAFPLPPDQLRNNNQWNLRMVGTWKFALTRGHIAVGGQYVSDELGPSAVFASSSESNNLPVNAFDGDPATRWCASDKTYPQWLAADLGTTEHITGVTIAWEQAKGHYLFRVEGSLDKKLWIPLADETAMPGMGDGSVTLTPGDFRYVRVFVTGDTEAGWASIRELQVHYAGANGQDVLWKMPTALPTSESVLDEFASPTFDDAAWDNMTVPSNWEILGYSLPTYNSVDNTVGQYRRWVRVPPSWAGRRIYWRFDGALEGAEVFVNGQKAGYHESGFTAFDVDVTGLVLPGKMNLFAVRVSKTVPSDDCETGDFQCMGGIYRETSLISVPQTHVSDITVRTPLDQNYRNATLLATVQVQAMPGRSVQVFGKLLNINDAPTGATVWGSAVAGPDGVAKVAMSTPVVAPALWSAEKPNLYYLVMQLSSSGRPVERVEQRFGFKQIDIKNHIVLWNGVPLKCTGTCRHDFWADKGFALSDKEWNKDLTLMKAANINAIRTSHYNHAERFLELCEERGMYILDEVPFCWINGSVNDPTYAPYLLQRATETLARDKNRPCVLAWSIGNENPMGPDVQQVLNLVKQTDPTRPAFVSWQNQTTAPGSAWQDEHYPDPDEIDRNAKNVANQTYVYSEQPHIFWQKEAHDYDPGVSDLWSEALNSTWQKIWAAPNILGSFVWEWQNQGIDDKNANKTTDFYYGPDRLRQENNKGIVDEYRNPKPEWWIVKQVYSPVFFGRTTVTPIGGKISVPLTNRYSFTDLDELTCKWTAFKGGVVLRDGTEQIACPALYSKLAIFPAPVGITSLRIEFDHADGTEVIAANLPVAGVPLADPPPAIAIDSPLTTSSTADTLTVSNDALNIIFDLQTGQIQSWTALGQTILTGGPTLNLGESRAGTEKGFYRATQPPVMDGAQVVASVPDPSGAIDVAVTCNVTSAVGGTALGSFTCTYHIQPNAEIAVNWAMNWTAPDTQLWEEGLKFTLPATANKLTWLRDSFFLDYPAGHIGEPSGTAGPTDDLFRASKYNLHWLTLTDDNGTGVALLASAGTPLVGRANTTSSGTLLLASTQVSGPRDLSGAWVADHNITAGKTKPLGGSFILRALAP